MKEISFEEVITACMLAHFPTCLQWILLNGLALVHAPGSLLSDPFRRPN